MKAVSTFMKDMRTLGVLNYTTEDREFEATGTTSFYFYFFLNSLSINL